MTKTPEYAEGYVSFWYDTTKDKWNMITYSSLPTYNGGNQKYYKVKLPIPEELLVDILPNSENIKVQKT